MSALNYSLVANGLLVTVGVGLYLRMRKYQQRLYINEGRRLGWPIPTVALSEFDQAFASNEHGPTLASEVHFIGAGEGVRSGTSDAEAWVLAVLAKRVLRMFEFGTGTGKTAYLLAKNSPPGATVTTLTLRPDQLHLYKPGKHDRKAAADRALDASVFTRFVYSGTDVEPKIEQLFGDSKTFDETPYLAGCDLIFIDGSHAYSYVKNDSQKALRMLKSGGIVLWHDYAAFGSNQRGVFDYLNELRERLELVHLRGTSMVAHRSAPAPETRGRAVEIEFPRGGKA